MTHITGYQNELFYNLTHRQLVCVSNSLTRHVRNRADTNAIRISHVLIKCAFYIVHNLAKRARTCMYNFEFVRIVNEKIRVTSTFVNLMMRLNDSLIYTEQGGWKDMIVDIASVCIESEETMNSKYAIVVGLEEQRAIAIRDIDYTGIINMTNNCSFRELGNIDSILDRVGDFSHALSMVAIVTTRRDISLRDAEHYESIHRLNIRTQSFKPWKLYSCKPVYPDCMSPFSYYDCHSITEFDANFVIPEDIGRIITEFVGHEFISNVRYGLIIAKKGRDAIRKDIDCALGTWRKNELLNFLHAVSYNYIKVSNFSTIISLKPSHKKSDIIDTIMSNFGNKELYYPFYRDVMILTPIIIKQRAIILNKDKHLRNRTI